MKMKVPLQDAQAIAQVVVDLLARACERIEIAGSIRRRCETVGDIEIVAIPDPTLDLFGRPTGLTALDLLLADMKVVLIKNGPRYKKFLTNDGNAVQVDLFLATPENWGYILMLRTGSAAFSKRMVTAVEFGGLRPPEIEVSQGQVYRYEQPVPVPTEEELFRLWGIEYIPPERRE